MKPCQLGYTCELMAEVKTNKWNEKICQIEQACQEWALSWALPYRYNAEKKELIVVIKASRYYWLQVTTYRNGENEFGKDCKINGMECGLYMTASQRMIAPGGEDELDASEIILKELTEAGWQEGVSISMQPKIARDGIAAVISTMKRTIGRLRNLIIDKLKSSKLIPNSYQTEAK